MKKQNIIMGIGFVFLILMVVGVSYAAYKFSAAGTKENVISTGTISMSYSQNSFIDLKNTYPKTDTYAIATKEDKSSMEFSVSMETSGTKQINYALAITNIEEGTTLKSDKVKIYLEKEGKVVNNFETNKGQTIESFKNKYVEGLIDSYAIYQDILTTSNKTHHYTLTAWIDESYILPIKNETTTTKETNKETYKFKVKVVGVDTPITIKEKSNATKGTDTLIALTNNQNESGLYTITHEADNTLQIGNDKDITEYRYRGANPKNYVTFNNEVWRIIGVFPTDDGTGNIENRIKLVSNESKYSWYWDNATTAYNYSKQDNLMLLQDNNKSKVEYLEKDKNYNVIMVAPSVTGYNNWARPASSNTYLNTTYYSSLNDDKNLISNVKYYLGGYNSTSTTSVDMYQYERKINGSTYYNGTNPNSWTGKIGFMYVSDYGYATENCENKMLYSTKSSSDDLRACNDINWLKNVISKSREGIIWTLDQGSHTGSHVYSIGTNGGIGLLAVGTEYIESYPVLYLKSDIQITGGSGTSSSPYTLGL